MVIYSSSEYWVIFHDILSSTVSKVSFRKTIRVSNSLIPDQARQNVRPDLGQDCLQRVHVSANDKSHRYQRKELKLI